MTQLHETTRLMFLQWQDLYDVEKPFEIMTEISEGAPDQRRTNLVFGTTAGKQFIQDIRGTEEQYSLDRHGFAYRKVPSSFSAFDEKERILKEYLPWAEGVIKKEVEDVGRVFIFDWRVDSIDESLTAKLRRADFSPRRVDLSERHQFLPVSTTCHVDQSAWEMLTRCRKFLGSDAEYLLQDRVRIVNLWRPLYQPIQDRPLTICDGSTVGAAELIETDYVRRDGVQETMYLLHNERQRWYYLSQQSPDEILLFKTFDSEKNVPARSKKPV